MANDLNVQMHKIIKEHKLKSCLRWLVAQKNPRKNGELYRVIAGKSSFPPADVFICSEVHRAFSRSHQSSML